jgi:uncharacterized membrane protein
MEQKIKHISHKLIDSLSDGVFSIALTLLGLDVVALVPEISHSENINSALLEYWPTFLSYTLGFLVLFSMWYGYHALGQYVEGTNVWIVWNHGVTMAWVALIPFGVALLAENLNTPNRKWGVFYFGICLFGQYWVNSLVGLFMRLKIQVNFTEDFPYPVKKMKKVLPILWLFGAVTGLILVPISLLNPWVALCGYGLFVISQANPITSFGKLIPQLLKRV